MLFSLFATLLSNLHLCHTREIKAKSDFTPVPFAGATPEEWTSYSTGQAGQAAQEENLIFARPLGRN